MGEQNIQESVKIEPPKVELLDEPVVEEHIGRKGSLSYKAEELDNTQSGIKLVDLDKNDGPKDELTFNIFDNLLIIFVS